MQLNEEILAMAQQMRAARDDAKPMFRQAVMCGRVAVAFEEMRLNVHVVEYTSHVPSLN